MNHAELRNQFNKDPAQGITPDMMRGTQSMGNLHGEPEPQRPDTMGLHRPRSEEFDRVHEWQQRNEMERQRLQQQQQRGPPNQGYNQPPQQHVGYGTPPADMQRPGPPHDQQGPPGQYPYYGTGARPGQPQHRGDGSPPYADMRRPEMEQPQRPAPEAVPKPHVAPKPGMKPDMRQSQMYDPRQQQQDAYQGHPAQGYPPRSEGYQPGPPPHNAPPQQGRYDAMHPVYSRPEPKQQHPMHQQQQPGYGRRGSPSPPPPPDVPPPPLHDNDRPPDELPPPPPVPVGVNPDYEKQIQEEQARMMKRFAETGPNRVSPPGRDGYDPRYKGYQGDRPPQQVGPQYQPKQQTPATHFNQSAGAPQQQQGGYSNYQNIQRGAPPPSESPAQNKPPYPYMSRQEPPEQSKPATTPTRPPVAQKPRFVIKPGDLQKQQSSPWEREQKELEKRRKEEESKARLDAEVGKNL